MKLLKIVATGLPLFKNSFSIDFLATQRVSTENTEKMSLLSSKTTKCFYLNNVLSFIGINASGKTTILKLISFVCRLLNNEAIQNISCNEILDGMTDDSEVVFDIYFHSDDNIYLLHTSIEKNKQKIFIANETLKAKPITKVKSKSDIFSFDNSETVLTRNTNNQFLLDDVSIMVAFNKQHKNIIFTDMLHHTNINQLSISKDCPPELIEFFDPNIEYIRVNNKDKDTTILLKFKDKEQLVLNQFLELNRYLSSGTIKGINTFLNAINTFKTGGYLIIDELENHFNHEIVSTLIRFYMDKKVNTNGAVLLFSTHYAEILDEFDRNDSIYIIRNRNGIMIDNLTSLLKRNDIKKSEAYESGFLEGTVPLYDAYMQLKNSIIQVKKES